MAFRKIGFLAVVFSLMQNILADTLDQSVVIARNLDSNDTNDYSGTMLNVAKACYSGFVQSIPPAFCYKKGGDFGAIPKACSNGYFRDLALCYQNCKSGYSFSVGTCWESCPSDYTSKTVTCYKSLLNWFLKKSYIPSSYTNFDSRATCDSGMYKSGALCYRDCGKISLLNCGIGACAATKDSCASSIASMGVNVLISLAQTVAFVASFGADSGAAEGFDAAKANIEKAFEKLSKRDIDAAIKSFQAVLEREGTEAFIKDTTDYALKNLAKFTATTVATGVVTNICQNVGNQMLNKMNAVTPASGLQINWQSFDLTGISGAVTSCQGVKTTNDQINCAQSVLNAVSFVDPTGLTSLAAAVMAPICNGV